MAGLSLARIDPLSVAYRNGRIHRRQYYVPYPNPLWHIDGNMSLCRWGFAVLGAVDGYSRMIVYLHCSTNNNEEKVLSHFIGGVKEYGYPSRVRSDFGGENIDVARFMILLRGTNRGSHLTGRSVHNQRIERMWRDVFSGCLSSFYQLFYFMKNSGILHVDSHLHIFALQYVYMPRIDQSLTAFRGAWNRHSIGTADNLSPIQLWVSGMLQNYHSHHSLVVEVFSGRQTGPSPHNSNESLETISESSDEVLQVIGTQDFEGLVQILQDFIDPLQDSSVWSIDIYVCVMEHLLDTI